MSLFFSEEDIAVILSDGFSWLKSPHQDLYNSVTTPETFNQLEGFLLEQQGNPSKNNFRYFGIAREN